MVVLDKVTKSFYVGDSTVRALNSLSCRFERCKMTAVCGKSGSGKSTLLHLIGGLDSVNSGHISVDGVNISGFNEKKLSAYRRRNIGFVFQFFNLIPELSVSENIRLACEICGAAMDEDYFTGLVKTLGLENRLQHLPGQLSGGQKQRTAIARALITKPKLLLLDEPTGNLDSEASETVYTMLTALRERLKQTIIVVTHDSQFAARADKIIYIKDGAVFNGGQGDA